MEIDLPWLRTWRNSSLYSASVSRSCFTSSSTSAKRDALVCNGPISSKQGTGSALTHKNKKKRQFYLVFVATELLFLFTVVRNEDRACLISLEYAREGQQQRLVNGAAAATGCKSTPSLLPTSSSSTQSFCRVKKKRVLLLKDSLLVHCMLQHICIFNCIVCERDPSSFFSPWRAALFKYCTHINTQTNRRVGYNKNKQEKKK